MGERPWLSLIPGIREYRIFKRCWKVRPFLLLLSLTIICSFILQAAAYVNISLPIPVYVKSRMSVISIVCLMIITASMYRRLAFAFGHDIGFTMGLLFLNPVFLGFLAFSHNTYNSKFAGTNSRDHIKYLIEHRPLSQKILSAVSIMFVVGFSVGYIGHVMLTEQQPAFRINKVLDSVYQKTSGKISGSSEVIYPAFSDDAITPPGVRSLYYPSKAGNSETTVYMYLVGSNLEDSVGSASINIAQIKDATAAGSSLRFIIEAGGSGRWFTDGFRRSRTARYLVQNGEVTLLETLPQNTSMSDASTLSDFLDWANSNYPSHRKMLFFWDHGGALSGFGKDIVNPRTDSALMPLSDLVDAVKSSNQKYDLIAFDSCFMQSLEVGLGLEPCADFLLASAEGEPGSGMYYTTAFSRLAKEPSLSTTRFAAMMCSSYDESIKALNGNSQPGYTMSMVDLRYLPAVYDLFSYYLSSLGKNFKTDKGAFYELSGARSRAYEFQKDDQIDLLDFIEQSDMSDSDKTRMTGIIKKAIVVRNAGSADHINGLGVYMPYNNLMDYTAANRQLTLLGMNSEAEVYNEFTSIIGSQKTSKSDTRSADIEYYKLQPWYVEGFEDYDVSLYVQDIGLTKEGDHYKIDLTEDEWKNITGYTHGLRIKVGNRYADLGSDDLYVHDSQGHYAMKFDDTWVSINGTLVALQPGTPKTNGDTTVFTGTVDALLNFTKPIKICMEWVNVGDNEGEGVVLGYLPADDNDDSDGSELQRGYMQFKTNSVITFLYDWYDEDGNYLSTAIGHLPIIVGSRGLDVKQMDISSEDYVYYGILKDAANRTLQTEAIHHPAKGK